jgi:hypothetical protein
MDDLPSNFAVFIGKRDSDNKERCMLHAGKGAMVVSSIFANFWAHHGYVAYEHDMDLDWATLAEGYDTVIVDDCLADDRIVELLRTDKRFCLVYQLPSIAGRVVRATR